MPRISPIQTSFAGGELSPRLRGRVDTDLYRVALASCLNWEITPQGSLRRWGGTVHAANVGVDPRARLVPFPQSDGQDYLLLLQHQSLQLYSLTGRMPLREGASGLNFIVNGDFALGPDGWTVTETDDTHSFVEFVNNDMRMYGERSGGEIYRAAVHQDFTPTTSVAATLRIAWKSARDHVRYMQVRVTRDGSTVLDWRQRPTAGAVTEFPVDLEAGHTYRLFLKLHLPSGDLNEAWGAEVVVDSISLSATSGGPAPEYELAAPWTADQLGAVHWAAEPGRDRVYFVHPNVRPWFLERNRATGAWTWAQIDFVAQPAEWTGTNWPSVVEVYQRRLWLASTPAEGNTVWASRSGQAFDFTLQDGSDPPTPSHAIKAPLSTKGRVRWMHGRQMLLVGTDGGEYSITAQGGVVTPSDPPQVRQESAFGSAAMQSIDVGDQVLYVSRDRRKVRVIDYALQSQAWASRELSFTFEHLTAPLIRQAAFARDPDGVLVLLLDDGTLVCCTYNRAEQVVAGYRVDVGGEVLDRAVVEGPEGSVLYLLVGRQGGVRLEMASFSKASPWRPSLHCAAIWVVKELPPEWKATAEYSSGDRVLHQGEVYTPNPLALPAKREEPPSSHWILIEPNPTNVQGLEHLEGETVQVVVDGTVTEAVVAGGEVPLPAGAAVEGQIVTLGLPFRSSAKTLPPEGGNPAGTAQGAKRRRPRVIVRLNESAHPLVNGERAPERSPDTEMDTGEPLFTGDDEIHAADWADDGAVTIEQDLPLQTEVLAIFGSLQVNE